jgi:L-amino acid N-acyltransferase YncA
MAPAVLDIRSATAADATSVLAIYAPIVRETIISFETEVPTVAEIAHRIDTTNNHRWWARGLPPAFAGVRPLSTPYVC